MKQVEECLRGAGQGGLQVDVGDEQRNRIGLRRMRHA
jgi:hypothetical protein